MTETVKRTRGKVKKSPYRKPKCPKCHDSGTVFDPKSGRMIGGQMNGYKLIPCPRCGGGKP